MIAGEAGRGMWLITEAGKENEEGAVQDMLHMIELAELVLYLAATFSCLTSLCLRISIRNSGLFGWPTFSTIYSILNVS